MVWLASLLLVLLWFLNTRQLDWRMALGGACVLIAGFALRHGWCSAATGQLAWDGSGWRWESIHDRTDSGEFALSVVADLQQILVVMLDNGSGSRLWFCAERSTFPERWLDFRRAVYGGRKNLASTGVDDPMAG